MRRTVFLVVALAACLFAQSGRETYRTSYRAWREADPMLEQDAAMGGVTVADAAGRKAVLAAKYGAERTDYLQRLAAGDEIANGLESAAPVEPPASSPPASSVDGSAYVAAETALVNRNIDAFANDPDQGIQKVRQMLDRERAALAALSGAIVERQKAANTTRDATAAMERVRVRALVEDRDLVAGLAEIVNQFGQETGGWAEYYRNLAESVGSSATPNAGATAGEASGNLAASPRTAPEASRPLVPSITPVPLVRYTGAWTFPVANGVYHGAQPEIIDLLVDEENGYAKGTFSARFKLPPGNTGDPVLRFDFEGDFKDTHSQTFDLTTSTGAKGTIELIPGDAFNLLEVNVRTDAAPGQIDRVNAVLIKK